MTLPVTSGLVLDLAVSSISASDGDTIATWTDSSGAGHNATAAGTPIYRTNQTPLAGPCVHFGGSDSYSLPSGMFTAATAAELFVVLKAPTTTTDNHGLYTLGGNDRTYYPFNDANVYDGAFTDTRFSFSPTVGVDSWRIYNVSHDGATWVARLDGAVQYTDTTGFSAPSTVYLARSADGLGWTGDIAELVCYNRALTATERSQVYTYLQGQYIAVPPSAITIADTSALAVAGRTVRRATVTSADHSALNVTGLDVPLPSMIVGAVTLAATSQLNLAGSDVPLHALMDGTIDFACASGLSTVGDRFAAAPAWFPPPHLPIEVRVYDRTGLGHFTVLPRRVQPSFTEAINDPGSGQVAVPFDDPVLAANASLLDWGNIVKFATVDLAGNYFEFSAFVIEQREIELVKEGESFDRMITVSGRGLRSLLENGEVLPFDGLTGNPTHSGTPITVTTHTRSGRARKTGPAVGTRKLYTHGGGKSRTALRKTSQIDRYFGWMSAPSDWLVGSEWDAPDTSTIAARMHIPPAAWPDATAEYIWPGPKGVRATVAGGRALFRKSFTTNADTNVLIHAVADNATRIFLDEQLILTASDYQSTFTTDPIRVGTGTHVLAVEVTNWLSDPGIYNPAGLLLTLVNADTNVVYFRTGDLGFLSTRMIYDGDPWVPGQSAAGLLIELMDEAADRGNSGIAQLSRDYDELYDSAGFLWPDHVERSLSIGTDLLNVADQLAEVAFDLRITPDMVVHAYLRQGDDFSTGTNPVRLLPGLNLLSMTITEGGAKPRTHLVTRDQAGWTETDSPAAQSRYGRIEGYAELGNSASIPTSKVVASATLPTLGQLPMTATATVAAVAGSIPLLDFDIGDRVLVPDGSGAMVPAEVLTISGQEADTGNDIDWTVELNMLTTVVPGGHPATEQLPVEGSVSFDSATPLDIFGNPIAHYRLAITFAAKAALGAASPSGQPYVPPPPNDNFVNAYTVTIPTDGATYTSDPVDNSTYTTEAGEPTSPTEYRTAWWNYTPATSGTATFDTGLTTQDTTPWGSLVPRVDVFTYTGTAVNALTAYGTGGLGASPTFHGKITGRSVTGGTTYRVRVASPLNSTKVYYVLQVTGPAT